MKIRLKNDTPKNIKFYMKEMKSLCGSEQALCKILLSKDVGIILERYPGRKQDPNKIGKKKNRAKSNWEKEQSTRIYWQLLSYLQTIGGQKYQVAFQHHSLKKGYSCKVIKLISHINFESLKELDLRGNGIRSIEGISFLNMPKLEKIVINQSREHFPLKTFAKTNFSQLKILQVSTNFNFAYGQTKFLNRARFNTDQEKDDEQNSNEGEQKKQFRQILKDTPSAQHLISLCAKIPRKTLNYSVFEWCYDNYKYQDKTFNIYVSVKRLVGT